MIIFKIALGVALLASYIGANFVLASWIIKATNRRSQPKPQFAPRPWRSGSRGEPA